MIRDEEAIDNALVKANVQAAMKKALSSGGRQLAPAALLRKVDAVVVKPAALGMQNVDVRKVHNHTTGEWRVDDTSGVALGKFATEADADAWLTVRTK